MKKLLFLLLLLLIPVSVLAKDTCDSNDIEIQSIVLENSLGNIEEVSNASISNQKINLGLKMNVIGDAAEYKLVLKNNSLEDYYFDEESLNLDKDFVNYEVLFDDNTNLIKGGEVKTITLKVSYREKIDASLYDDGVYNGSQVVELNVMNLDNPFTGRFLGILVFISLLIGFFVFYKNSKKTAYLLLIIGLTIPFHVNAICKHSFEVNTNLVIDVKEAMFLPGKEVNIKMKELAGDDTSTVTYGYNIKDQLIASIKYSENEPGNENKEEKNIVSTAESRYPIYMWFDNGTIYWWSEDKTPALNEDASYMFHNMVLLSDILGLRNFDASYTVNMHSLFALIATETIVDLRNWNTSKVENMVNTFFNMLSLKSLSGLENWDTSNVTEMEGTFSTDWNLRNMEAIKNWNVEKVKNMRQMFFTNLKLEIIDLSNWKTSSLTDMSFMIAMGTPPDGSLGILKNIILSDKFDSSNVTDMTFAFYNNQVLEDYSFLQYLDTSSVTTIQDIFYYNYNLKSAAYMKDWNVSNLKNMSAAFIDTGLINLNGFNNWDTSSVEDMSYAFRGCDHLESLSGIENWDVSSVTSFSYMFAEIPNLNDSAPINDWDIPTTASFYRMFSGTPGHPEFSKVPGRWDGRKTFIPTN